MGTGVVGTAPGERGGGARFRGNRREARGNRRKDRWGTGRGRLKNGGWGQRWRATGVSPRRAIRAAALTLRREPPGAAPPRAAWRVTGAGAGARSRAACVTEVSTVAVACPGEAAPPDDRPAAGRGATGAQSSTCERAA